MKGYERLHVQAESTGDDGLADDLSALQKQLTDLEREEHRLLDAYQAGLIDLDQLAATSGTAAAAAGTRQR